MFDWKKAGQLGPEEPQDPFAGMDPMVVEHIKRKMGGVDAAQKQADMANYAGIATSAADSLANAFNQPVALGNRMQDLGKAPAMLEGRQQKTDVSGMQRMAENNLQGAKTDREQALQMMLQQRKEELAAQVAAKRQGIEDERYNKNFTAQEGVRKETARHNKAMEGKAKEVDPTLAAIREQQLIKATNENVKPKLTPADQKAAATNKEVGYRVNSINSALDRLKQNVEDNGTFEMLGTASSDMDSDLYNVALDYAKLVDPDSVAREGEVAAAKKYMLPIKGLGVRNDTAQALIKRMKDQVNQRALDMGATSAQPQTSSEDQAAIDWAKANPNDPRAAQILKLHGG